MQLYFWVRTFQCKDTFLENKSCHWKRESFFYSWITWAAFCWLTCCKRKRSNAGTSASSAVWNRCMASSITPACNITPCDQVQLYLTHNEIIMNNDNLGESWEVMVATHLFTCMTLHMCCHMLCPMSGRLCIHVIMGVMMSGHVCLFFEVAQIYVVMFMMACSVCCLDGRLGAGWNLKASVSLQADNLSIVLWWFADGL